MKFVSDPNYEGPRENPEALRCFDLTIPAYWRATHLTQSMTPRPLYPFMTIRS